MLIRWGRWPGGNQRADAEILPSSLAGCSIVGVTTLMLAVYVIYLAVFNYLADGEQFCVNASVRRPSSRFSADPLYPPNPLQHTWSTQAQPSLANHLREICLALPFPCLSMRRTTTSATNGQAPWQASSVRHWVSYPLFSWQSAIASGPSRASLSSSSVCTHRRPSREKNLRARRAGDF